VSVFAIDLNDRALSVCSQGRVLTGAPAARHWRELAQESSPSGRTLELITADLSARLREHPPPQGARVWAAAPAVLGPTALGLVLGAARTLAPIEGFVDAAVASAAALGLDRPALAVELGLHHVAVTQLDFAGQIRRRRVASNHRGGLLDLYRQWLTLLGEIFVKRTRFDPLHDAASEQRLSDLLPSLTAEVERTGSATAVLDSRGRRLEVPISQDQLAEAARPFYRQLLTLLHSLRPAGAPVALLMPQALIELPGWRPLLSEFSGCELILLGDGFAGCALSVLDLPPAAPATQTVPLLRRLPAQRHDSAVLLADRELIERDTQRSQPTHVLVGARTVVLGSHPLVVGRALAETDSIGLPEGLAGVSRRHCTFMRERDAVVLIDHSRCGTFVNGERVTERVRVHAGDRVRLGEPGIELALIAVDALLGTSHASPAN
jgi:FHA domain